MAMDPRFGDEKGRVYSRLGDQQARRRKSACLRLCLCHMSDVLDPALLRPGRFDRRVSVERPDKIGREQVRAFVVLFSLVLLCHEEQVGLCYS
eukprot:scaffold66302_cov16-Tisochrysis_lutea.AAC.1